MKMDSYKLISEIERNHILALTKKGLRIDGRGFKDVRDITIETGYIPKAEGSSKVTLGNTMIVAGVKVSIGSPYADTPDSGVITVNAELSPMASPEFEPGPPDENSVEVARVVDRGIRHSNIVDKDKLVIIPGEKVFVIFLDLYVVSYDGNLYDAGEIAAVKALMDTKLPKLPPNFAELKGEWVPPVKEDIQWIPLEISDYPVSVTIAKIGDALVVDPNANEERILDSRLTITINSKNEICSMQKGGAGSLTFEDISNAIDMAQELAPKLQSRLKESK
jgi:exosome complex component RRP42